MRAAATRTADPGASDDTASLRDLDPRQRRLLPLFRDKGAVSSSEMAEHLKLAPRTLVGLSRAWIASGFLEYQSAARKTRSYKLGARYLPLLR